MKFIRTRGVKKATIMNRRVKLLKSYWIILAGVVGVLVVFFGSVIGYFEVVKTIVSKSWGPYFVGIVFIFFLFCICLLCKVITQNISIRKDAKKIYDVQTLLSDMYGFKRKYVKIETEIEMDGSAESKTTIDVLSTKYELRTCYHEEFITAVENPDKDQLKMEPYLIKTGDREIKFPTIESGLDHINWLAVFIPPLNPGDDSVTYGYRTYRKNVHAMTIEEARKTPEFPYERTSYQIIYPTDYLEIKLLFPKKYFPRVSFMVYLAYERNKCLFEFEKLKRENCFVQKKERERLEVILRISSPKLGFIYQIEWEPLSALEYEKVRKLS